MSELLFLAHRIPYPPDRGDKIRSWRMLERLARRARVHLACFADDAADAAHLAALRDILGEGLGEVQVQTRHRGRLAGLGAAMASGKPVSLTLFDSPALRRFVALKLAGGRIDTVFAFSGQMAQFVPAGIHQRFVMDFVDVDSAKFDAYARAGPLPMRWINGREARRLAAFERAVAARADANLFVSEAEAALFRDRTGLPRIHAVSNGIDTDHFDPAAGYARLGAGERGEGPLVLFTGQMDYRPNVEAVLWFADEVLPRLPEARLAIAGRNPAPAVRRLASDRVIVTGAVADMRSWLAAADLVVAPLRIARGIQNKVLEAMAMARPVVASPAAAEGIDAEDGRDLIVADGADAMAAAIDRLLAAPERAREMGAGARRRMLAGYGWDARLAPLDDLVFPGARKAA